jgi:sulfatase modifying factor 1
MANTWQGRFPVQNLLLDGYLRTSPVGAFPANGYGLFDMIGNVWEWTDDYWVDRHAATHPAGAVDVNPRARLEASSFDCGQPASRIPCRVVKGGSHLCSPDYSRRYRPAARSAEPEDSSSSHVGFRCVRRLAATAATAATC